MDILAPEVSSDGVTVWVNYYTGSIARFGKNGIDVHTTDTTGCLYCTHEPTTARDWETFKEKVWDHHCVVVSDEHKPVRFLCGATDGLGLWVAEGDPEQCYGRCTLPLGHSPGPMAWHREDRDGKLWAEWRGPNPDVKCTICDKLGNVH